MKRIYFDHASTTPVDKEVLKEMQPYFSKNFGNPSSLFYSEGMKAEKAVSEAREKIAELLNAEPKEIVFTSGGTEAINLALIGAARANKQKGSHIISTKIEHPAVLETLRYLEKNGFSVTYVAPDKEGFVSPADIEKEIKKETVLVAVEHANIEVGTIQNISEIGKICRQRNILFFSNAEQTVGKIPVNVSELNVDMLSFSAHKFYGPKGIGALYVKKGVGVEPLIYGGGHEFGLRSGTENVAGIVGMAKALGVCSLQLAKEMKKTTKLRDKLISLVLSKISDSWLNGHRTQRLPGNANFGFKYIEGEGIVMSLDMKGIAASTGSACSSKNLKASHVLLAMGQPQEYTHGSVRFTLDRENTSAEVDRVVKALKETVEGLREISPYGKGKEEY